MHMLSGAADPPRFHAAEHPQLYAGVWKTMPHFRLNSHVFAFTDIKLTGPRLLPHPGRDYVALAKGFPALALMSEGDLSEDFGPFASALEGALDPIVTDFRQQMVRTCVKARAPLIRLNVHRARDTGVDAGWCAEVYTMYKVLLRGCD